MTSFLTDAGYWALIVFAFVQACCIPISSEVTFGFAGVLAYQGHLSLVPVIVIGSLAELAGSSVAYGLGRRGGRDTVERYRRYLLMTRKDVERTERFFAGRGAWAVGVGRLLPLVRTFVGLVAGLMEVPLLPFEFFNVLGTVIWATTLSLIGYALGSDWTSVAKNFSHASDGLAILVILLVLALIGHKALQLRRERRAEVAEAVTAAPDSTGPEADASGGGDPAAPAAGSQGAAARAAVSPRGPGRPGGHA